MRRSAAVACLFVAALLSACNAGASPRTAQSAPSAPAPPPAQALAAIAACPPSPIPDGLYTKTITANAAKAYAKSHQRDYVGFIVGTWTWGVGAPGPNCFHNSWFVLRNHGRVVFVDEHPYTVEGPDRIALYGAQEPVGLYIVRTRAGSVRMFGISDWPVRRMVKEIGRWTLRKSVP